VCKNVHEVSLHFHDITGVNPAGDAGDTSPNIEFGDRVVYYPLFCLQFILMELLRNLKV